MKKIPLIGKILIGLVIGGICGFVFGEDMKVVQPIGTLFLNLLMMAVIPLIVCNLVSGIASLRDVKAFGKIGGGLLVYYVFTTTFAILVGSAFAFTLKPGTGYNLVTEATELVATKPDLLNTVVNLFPSNIFAALSSGNMAQVVFFCVFLGVALLMLPSEHSEPLLTMFVHLSKLFNALINLVMKFAPIGIACLFGSQVGINGTAIASVIGKFAVGMYAGTAIMYVIYCFSVQILARYSPIEFLKKAFPVMVTGVATNSSNATIPTTMEWTEKMGVSKKVSDFAIPLGAVMNKNGMGLFLSLTFIFTAQSIGYEITLPMYLQMMLIGLILTTGAGGVAGGQIVVLTILLDAFGLPSEAIAVVMAITPFTDPAQTCANIISDMAAAKVGDARARSAARKSGQAYYDAE